MNPLLTALNSNRGEGRRPPCSSQHSRPGVGGGALGTRKRKEHAEQIYCEPQASYTLTSTMLLGSRGSPCPKAVPRLCDGCQARFLPSGHVPFQGRLSGNVCGDEIQGQGGQRSCHWSLKTGDKRQDSTGMGALVVTLEGRWWAKSLEDIRVGMR